MDIVTIVGWVIAAAAVVAAVYFRVTGQVTEKDFLARIAAAQVVAQGAVEAAEQLWQTGQIERDYRFDWAAARIRSVVPDVTDDQLEMLIESAVYLIKRGVNELVQE